MSVKEDVLKVMKEAGKPLSAGEVEKILQIDRKEIDKAFKELKAELFNLRFQHAINQLENPMRIQTVKRDYKRSVRT